MPKNVNGSCKSKRNRQNRKKTKIKGRTTIYKTMNRKPQNEQYELTKFLE
jgi:hypothetical protein